MVTFRTMVWCRRVKRLLVACCVSGVLETTTSFHIPQPPPYLPSPFTSSHWFCLFSPACTITNHYVYLATPFSSFSLSAPTPPFSSEIEPYNSSRTISKQIKENKESNMSSQKNYKRLCGRYLITAINMVLILFTMWSQHLRHVFIASSSLSSILLKV